MPALPMLGETPLVPLAAIAILLVLLGVVVSRLVRTIRSGATPEASEEAEAAASSPFNPGTSQPPPPDQDEADLTRMKVFSADLLPRLSLDDDDAEQSDPALVTEESKPNLLLEEGVAATVEPAGDSDVIVTSAASQTHRGLKRTRNEDACLVDAKLDLYIVADGMGGYAGGDVAANTAVAEVHKYLKAPPSASKPECLTPADWPRIGRELSVAVEHANAVIHDVSKKSKQLEGMGTTILTARFARREQRMYVAYVGDSRVYRLRAGKLQKLTLDHTLGAKGVVGPLASNVRRAVGVSSSVKVDLLIDKPLPDDLYVFCSDGVYKMVKDAEMTSLLSGDAGAAHAGWTETELKSRVASIVDAANAAGGKDNITVVLVGISAALPGRERAAGRAVETRA